MGRLLPCVILIASAIGCGNPSRATVDAAEQPPIDALVAPGQFGGACSKHTDCESGYCVEPVGNTGGVCSRVCNNDCPTDWECRLVTLPQAQVRLCVPAAKQLCLACTNDTECGGGTCLTLDGGGRCATPCSGQCPTGYTCAADPGGTHPGSFCQPITGSCTCSDAMAGAQRSCANTNSVGTCLGMQTCSATTGWSTCTARTPAAETCDGVDNDCNFLIDDGVGGGGACANTNAYGSCSGIRQCDGTNGFICAGRVPMAEMCNGIDDNCNGVTDIDAFPALGSSCTTGVGACTRYGSMRCNGAQNGLVCSAVAGAPTAELCNQVDDNCDGSVDEPFKTGPMALGTVCSAGLGVCTQYGTYVCNASGSATQCTATPANNAVVETCNYRDDNCDGIVDNGFLNPNTGFYDTDKNCGACGNDCTTLYNGANAYGACQVTASPQCVMRCNPGSGNLNNSTVDGCEFTIDSTAIYVSTSDLAALDDVTCGLGPTGTGVGNHPCKTISNGLIRTLATGRTQVLVADGTYDEGVGLINGKNVLGGYRADTWERHLTTTNTVIAGALTSGNNDKTVIANTITSPTIFEGFVIRGSFNTKPSGNSYGVYITNSSASLVIRNNRIFAGRGGSGSGGSPGANGAAGGNGGPYSASAYDSFQTNTSTGCLTSAARAAYGGASASCGANAGGNGGGNNCTPMVSTQNSTATSPASGGQPGAGPGGGLAGAAGARGYDADLFTNRCNLPAQGNGTLLPMFGADGKPGTSGAGAAGVAGCTAAAGSVNASGEWVGGTSTGGIAGSSGGGGGGGGAGGGATCTFCVRQGMNWVDGGDILGAHGGGGGSGGCGGSGGLPGAAGGGAFGIFVVGSTAPTMTANAIELGTGGVGGTGGIGGGGGLGGVGGPGGDQGTATILFCSGKGGRGGDGGNGGPGSGGGGGCGGSSYGIYTSGVGNYCGGNTNPTAGGTAGTGGTGGFSGGNSGGPGANGAVQACVSL